VQAVRVNRQKDNPMAILGISPLEDVCLSTTFLLEPSVMASEKQEIRLMFWNDKFYQVK
jgi:hypothetical protein